MRSEQYFLGTREELALLVPKKCDRILDVGCGYGGLGRQLRSKGFKDIYGIEINPDSAAHLQAQYSEYWIGDVEQFVLPAGLDRFDCIIFADILEHLRDPWNVLKRYIDWLKPGGYVIASIPNIRNIAVVYNLIVKGKWQYKQSGILDKSHLRFFTRKEIIELFEHSGLKIEFMSENREQLTLKRRILTAPLFALIPDLAVCQYLIRAYRP
jgi:2-polyprenyl-3-methyl-5-hydroxy-6-metoxy-1,4-benzoquinol methylase